MHCSASPRRRRGSLRRTLGWPLTRFQRSNRRALANPRVIGLACTLVATALLGGCSEDPLGPENRFALIAFGQCSHRQALMLVDQAIARGNADNIERGLMMKAAILRDQGDSAAAEALYPEIDAAWAAAKGKALSPNRRARDIQMYIDIAKAERHAKGLDPECKAAQAAEPAAQPSPEATAESKASAQPAALD